MRRAALVLAALALLVAGQGCSIKAAADCMSNPDAACAGDEEEK